MRKVQRINSELRKAFCWDNQGSALSWHNFTGHVWWWFFSLRSNDEECSSIAQPVQFSGNQEHWQHRARSCVFVAFLARRLFGFILEFVAFLETCSKCHNLNVNFVFLFRTTRSLRLCWTIRWTWKFKWSTSLSANLFVHNCLIRTFLPVKRMT